MVRQWIYGSDFDSGYRFKICDFFRFESFSPFIVLLFHLNSSIGPRADTAFSKFWPRLIQQMNLPTFVISFDLYVFDVA